MGTSFFIVYGNENFNLSGADVGALTAVLLGSQAVMQLGLGWLGDRRGPQDQPDAFLIRCGIGGARGWLRHQHARFDTGNSRCWARHWRLTASRI